MAKNIIIGNMESSKYDPNSKRKEVAFNDEVVKNTGNQTITGVKTFSSSPIVPTPTTDMEVATKKYVDDEIIETETNSIDGNYTIKPDGTKAYFSFDGTDYDFANNKIKDNSPFTSNDGTLTNFTRNDGTVSGGVTIVGGMIKGNGTTGFIDFSTHPQGVKSISFDILPTSTTDYFLNLVGTSIYVWANAGTITVTGFTSPTIYVNGVVSSTIVANVKQRITITTATEINGDNFEIGRTANTNHIAGSIDNIKLWSVELNSTEVANETTDYFFNTNGILNQYSGRNFAGTEANPTTIYDTNMIVSNGYREGIICGINTLLSEFFTTNISFKFMVNSYPQDNIIFASNNYIRFRHTTNNDWRFSVRNNDGTTIEKIFSGGNSFIGLNEEYVLSFKIDWINLNVKFYKNGDYLVGEDLTLNGIKPSGKYTQLSKNKGIVYDILVGNRLWSEEEIKAYSQRTKKLFSDNNGSSGDFGVSGDLKVGGNIESSGKIINTTNQTNDISYNFISNSYSSLPSTGTMQLATNTKGLRIIQSSAVDDGSSPYLDITRPQLELTRSSSTRGVTLSMGNSNGKACIYTSSGTELQFNGKLTSDADTNMGGFNIVDAVNQDACLKIGAYYLWVDSTGDLRIKSTAPTSDTDGTVVGTQS